MNGQNNQDPELHQYIDGDKNQIAGRDIINEGPTHRPDLNKPGIIPCKSCSFPISKMATECPECGHDYNAEYQLHLEQAKIENENFKSKFLLFLAIIVIGGMQLATRTQLGLMKSMGIVAISAILLWFGWVWLKVYIEDELNKKKTQGK